jgi:hypothetical protein
VVSSSAVRDDIVDEAIRLVEAARQEKLVLRALGGVAVQVHVGEAMRPSLARDIQDMDFATPRDQGRSIQSLLSREGYVPNIEFNRLHGAQRLIFVDDPHGRHIDVFVGTFAMCHVIPLSERLALEPTTVPLAELFMTKLQIVKLNRKDMVDAYALLLAHYMGDNDAETINANRIAQVAAADWGLFHTIDLNLGRLRERSSEFDLSPTDQATIAARLEALGVALERHPKSMRWSLRARVGERMPWYEEPEEVVRQS